MRTLILTQNDNFVLPACMKSLINNLPQFASINAALVFTLSPLGEDESILKQSAKVLRLFGLKYFLRNGFKYVKNTLFCADVIKVFSEYNIPVLKVRGSINSQQSLDTVRSYEPDLIISIGSNQIFRQPLIEIPRKGIINLHSSLLPKYRGVLPTFWVLRNDEKYTGVSVFFVDKGIDSGPILVQKRIPIGIMSHEELVVVSKQRGMEAIIEAIELIEHGNYVVMENDDSKMTYFSWPSREDIREFKRLGKRFY